MYDDVTLCMMTHTHTHTPDQVRAVPRSTDDLIRGTPKKITTKKNLKSQCSGGSTKQIYEGTDWRAFFFYLPGLPPATQTGKSSQKSVQKSL
jgi:hypothetical protein